jgi:lipopolysaccharide transport system ATP-binding protein
MRDAGDYAIEVANLTKRYRLGVFDSNLRRTLAQGAGRLARAMSGRSLPEDETGYYWALNDVSFNVGHGEIVGVIGKNGAGKSTLLKILARITEPTSGEVRYRGQVGSLLEVGTGFHPELSGRDNIFLNGAILGMGRREIQSRYDEIVEFSGVGDFVDTPVKRYSSGMYMRLAFAVAAHLETNILLIDEVLAVGDAEFQNKCLARMSDLAKGGRTVVFVSHNLTAIQSLCRRSIFLEKGRAVADGPTREVLSAYLRNVGEGDGRGRTWTAEEAPSNELMALRGVRVVAAEGDPDGPLDVTRPFTFVFDYERFSGKGEPMFKIGLHDASGVLVFCVGHTEPVPNRPGFYRDECPIPADLLNAGQYTLSVELNGSDELYLDIPNVLAFELLDSPRDRRGWFGVWEGVLRPRFDWRRSQISQLSAQPLRQAQGSLGRR